MFYNHCSCGYNKTGSIFPSDAFINGFPVKVLGDNDFARFFDLFIFHFSDGKGDDGGVDERCGQSVPECSDISRGSPAEGRL